MQHPSYLGLWSFDEAITYSLRGLCWLWYILLHAYCRNMPFRGRARQGSRVRFPKEERCAESPPTFICGKRRKNRRKPVKIQILSSGVVFTFEECISTSHVCLKGQQPLIKCANMTSILCSPLRLYFFLYFLSFCGRRGCFPCSYVFLNCDKEIRPT